jgi:DNA-directed RNA polymerase subunit RPC12/RpoP
MKRNCHDCRKEFEANTTGLYCRGCSSRRMALMTRAMSAVSAAVRDRLLPNLRVEETACVDCGDRATCYDHRDYNKPIAVEPVCRTCNRLRGPAVSTMEAA